MVAADKSVSMSDMIIIPRLAKAGDIVLQHVDRRRRSHSRSRRRRKLKACVHDTGQTAQYIFMIFLYNICLGLNMCWLVFQKNRIVKSKIQDDCHLKFFEDEKLVYTIQTKLLNISSQNFNTILV